MTTRVPAGNLRTKLNFFLPPPSSKPSPVISPRVNLLEFNKPPEGNYFYLIDTTHNLLDKLDSLSQINVLLALACKELS